jgi:hypothetical protein
MLMILHSNEQKKRSESRKRYLTVYAVLELSKDLLRTRGTTSISTSILQWTSTNASKRSLVITLVGFKALAHHCFKKINLWKLVFAHVITDVKRPISITEI